MLRFQTPRKVMKTRGWVGRSWRHYSFITKKNARLSESAIKMDLYYLRKGLEMRKNPDISWHDEIRV
jgi:hypothetical protein